MTATTTTPIKFDDQKMLARAIDRAAARCESVNADPATPKQAWFLAGLILKSGERGEEFFLNTSLVFTKRRASSMIDQYLKS